MKSYTLLILVLSVVNSLSCQSSKVEASDISWQNFNELIGLNNLYDYPSNYTYELSDSTVWIATKVPQNLKAFVLSELSPNTPEEGSDNPHLNESDISNETEISLFFVGTCRTSRLTDYSGLLFYQKEVSSISTSHKLFLVTISSNYERASSTTLSSSDVVHEDIEFHGSLNTESFSAIYPVNWRSRDFTIQKFACVTRTHMGLEGDTETTTMRKFILNKLGEIEEVSQK